MHSNFGRHCAAEYTRPYSSLHIQLCLCLLQMATHRHRGARTVLAWPVLGGTELGKKLHRTRRQARGALGSWLPKVWSRRGKWVSMSLWPHEVLQGGSGEALQDVGPSTGGAMVAHGAGGRINTNKSGRGDSRAITDRSSKNVQINAPDTQKQIMNRKS